jgi:hypothetical protein
MNTEARAEGRSPLIGINDLADALARKHLLDAEFTGRSGTVPFPGEGKIGYYQMFFALGTSMRRTTDELLFYGNDTRPGIHIQKSRLCTYCEKQPGFEVSIRRIVIQDNHTDPPVYMLARHELKADLSTGEMSLIKNLSNTREPGLVLAELESVIADLRTPTTVLTGAGYSDRISGFYHRLVRA